MPGLRSPFRDTFATPAALQPRFATLSRMQQPASNVRYEPVLFPAGFGLTVGERFDDVSSIPAGLSIDRIKRITLYHGAWIDSISTVYVLSDGSEFTCTTGRKGGRASTYDFQDNEILFAMGGLLGFIKNTDIIVDDLMIDYVQWHIKNVDTGEIRVVPEDPETFGCAQGADWFIQGPILAFSGRHAGYLSQIQPYLAKERNADIGMPNPGVAFDDRKALRKDSIASIKQVVVSAGAWIDGMEVVYETASGRIVSQKHGGNGGAETVIDLAAGEVIEAICICNSGPFPFCDAMRFYLVQYSPTGDVLSRRTVPDKSSPAFGYEYEFGESTWLRSGKGSTVFALAGVSGSYIEQLAFWVRDNASGEERLVKPVQMASTPSGESMLHTGRSHPPLSAVMRAKIDEHRRSISTVELLPPISSSLTSLPNFAGPANIGLSASPEINLPTSCPSSPSLPVSLGRLSFCSTDSSSKDASPPSATLDPGKKKRLSAQLALLHGEDIQKQARRMSNGNLAPV